MLVLGMCIAFWLGISALSKDRGTLPQLVIVLAIIVTICAPFYFDYYTNFSTYFGPAGDDEIFYAGMRHVLYGEAFPGREVNIYSYYLAIALFPIAVFRDITLIDALIVHWFTAAVAVLKFTEFSRLLGLRSNVYVTLFFCVSSFVFLDAVVHLYREAVILLFTALALIKILENKKAATLIHMIPVFLFRAGNVVPIGMFWVFRSIKLKATTKVVVFVIVLGVGLTSLNSVLPQVVKFAAMYGSDVTRLSRRGNAFSAVHVDDIIEGRQALSKEHTNVIKRWAYGGQTPVHIFTRIAFTFAFPISIKPIEDTRAHTSQGQVSGVFWSHSVVNFFIVTRGFFMICVLIGLLRARSLDQLSMTSALVLFSVVAVLTSGQSRHLLVVHTIAAIYATHGFLGLRERSAQLGGMVILSVLYTLGVTYLAL